MSLVNPEFVTYWASCRSTGPSIFRTRVSGGIERLDEELGSEPSKLSVSAVVRGSLHGQQLVDEVVDATAQSLVPMPLAVTANVSGSHDPNLATNLMQKVSGGTSCVAVRVFGLSRRIVLNAAKSSSLGSDRVGLASSVQSHAVIEITAAGALERSTHGGRADDSFTRTVTCGLLILTGTIGIRGTAVSMSSSTDSSWKSYSVGRFLAMKRFTTRTGRGQITNPRTWSYG